MKIRRILLHNLHSIRQKVEVDFTTSPLADTGLFAITGDTGAGKTTILDAITLALYGEICRKAKPEDALSYGAEEGLAECEFETKDRRFLAQWRVRTTRSKDPDKRLKSDRSVAEWDEKTGAFHIIAERKVMEVNALIEEVTGLDFPRFTRSVLLAQGEFAAFLKASEKERSDLLERITGTEIYSELSKAALERKNLEQEKLAALTSQRDSLQLLSKEELTEKKADLKFKKTDDKTNRELLAGVKESLAQLELVERLRARKLAADGIVSALAAEHQSSQADLARLEAHHKALPLHTDLARLEDKLEEREKLKEELHTVEAVIEKKTVQGAVSQEKMEVAKSQFDELRAGQKDAFRLFEEVSALDEKIDSRQPIFAKHKTELEELDSLRKTWNNNKLSEENAIADHEQAIGVLREWLDKNTAAANLPKDLPTIKIFRKTIEENWQEQQVVERLLQSLKGQLESAQQSAVETEQKWQTERAALDKLNADFQQKTPVEFTNTRHDLLEKLTREIESAAQRQGHLQQLRTLNEDYAQTLAEIQALETELDNLRREELALDKQLLTAVEAADQAESHLKFKQSIYQQQLLVANFEQTRAELQEGEPCPVCLSTEHPFRGQVVKPYVDESKKELEAAEAALASLHKVSKSLIKRHLEVASAIQRIDSSTAGQLGKLNVRLLAQERKMTTLFPHFDGEGIVESYGGNLLKRLSDFDAKLALKKAAREELATLHAAISHRETEVRKLESERRDLAFQVSHLQEKCESTEKNLAELKEKFKRTTDELNLILDKYGYHFLMEKANGIFTHLEGQERIFSEKTALLNQHERKLELAKQSLSQTKASAGEVELKFAKLEAELMQEEKQLNDLNVKRLGLFGEKTPQVEREQFLKKIEESEISFSVAKSAHEALISALNISQKTKKDLQGRLEKNNAGITGLHEKLTERLSVIGFDSLEALRQAILPDEETERIQLHSEHLRKRQIEVEQDLKNLTSELETALAQPLPEQTAKELSDEAARLESLSRTNQQAIGALQQQLHDNKARSEEAKRLLAEIDGQRAAYNRWMALYDLIGSSDGKKFRVFAQGLTLAKLVQLANVHLANLHGRYSITKRPGQDLELDIVDTYQADNVRSMHTLSGGESFLVSLALALGLSDLAGRNANIRSLFIDEGFGSLDDQALDLAVTTLENLQAGGKTIGIISHVKELKERISTQVRLVKKGGGMSEVEVVG